ncbi:MAG: hypothetical protein HY367_03960 [Candidatus Aenigmarchaeota archaeon]|nr:hypothetical protein [Candidatus Aenigmarchaeota archaeon]
MEQRKSYDSDMIEVAMLAGRCRAMLEMQGEEKGLKLYDSIRTSGEEAGRKLDERPPRISHTYTEADFYSDGIRLTTEEIYGMLIADAIVFIAKDYGKLKGYLERREPDKLDIFHEAYRAGIQDTAPTPEQ